MKRHCPKSTHARVFFVSRIMLNRQRYDGRVRTGKDVQSRQTEIEIDRGTLNTTSTAAAAGTYSHGHLYRPRPVAVTVGQEC